jgi:hypothetical protein
VPASAAIDPLVQAIVKQELGAELRVDGLAQQGSKSWLLLVPNPLVKTSNGANLSSSYKSNNGDLLLSNGWIYTPIIPGRKENSTTIKSYDFYPQIIKDNILSSIIIPEFLVPAGFVLPRDLAMLAGHLPIGLADVELASNREEQFRRRLKDDEANSFSLLSYDYSKGKLKHIEFKPGAKADSPEMKISDIGTEDYSLITSLRKSGKDIFLADFNKATIYTLKAKDGFARDEYLKVPGVSGLKDFAFSTDATLLYVLTLRPSKLFVYKVDGLKLIREMDMAAAPFSLQALNPSDSEADYMLVATKSNSEIVLVGTFDHRISSRISMLADNLMPDAYAAEGGDVFVIAKDRLKGGSAKLLALDLVTGTTDMTISLGFEPSTILSHAASIYVAGTNPDGRSALARINPMTFTVESSCDLGTDIIEPSTLAISNTGAFMLVGSAAGENIGVVDLLTMQLVKKFNIGVKSHQLLIL